MGELGSSSAVSPAVSPAVSAASTEFDDAAHERLALGTAALRSATNPRKRRFAVLGETGTACTASDVPFSFANRFDAGPGGE